MNEMDGRITGKYIQKLLGFEGAEKEKEKKTK